MFGRHTARRRSRSAASLSGRSASARARRDRPTMQQARRADRPSLTRWRAPNRRLGAPTIFLDELLHRPVLEHLLGQQPLEFAVLPLKLAQLANVLALEAGVFLTPRVERELA